VHDLDIVSMEGYLPQLSEDERHVDLFKVLGDSIQFAFLALAFFEAVAFRISNQIISANRPAGYLHIGTR
jgi:hypothetical protein